MYHNKSKFSISELTNSLLLNTPIEEQIKILAEHVKEYFDVDICIIRSLRGDKLVILTSAGVPQTDLDKEISIKTGISFDIIHTGKPLSIYDIEQYYSKQKKTRLYGDKNKFVSYAGAPLKLEGKVIGIIGVYQKNRNRRFTDIELENLQILANQVAIRVENNRLYNELQKNNVELHEKITQIQETEKELAYRFEIEKLVASISAQFVKLISNEIDDGINWALKSIGKFTQVDRSYLFLFNPENTMTNTHEWCESGVEPQIGFLKNIPLAEFPWWTNKIKNCEEIYIPKLSELTQEAEKEKEALQAQDIKSLIVIPLIQKGSAIGFLGLDSVKREKSWNENDINLLKMVSEIIVNSFEKRDAEKSIFEAESKFKSLVEQSISGIYIVQDKNFKYVNPKFCEIFGYSFEEMINKLQVIDLVYQEDKDLVSQNVQKRISGEIDELRYSFRGQRKDGKIVHVEVHGRRIIYENKAAVIGVLLDITDRIETEAALRNSEAKFRSVSESSPIGILIYQGKKIVYSNKALEEISGYSFEDLKNKNFWENVAEDYREKIRQNGLLRQKGDTIPEISEIPIITKSGKTIWIEYNVRIIEFEGKSAGLISAIDISKRKMAESEIIKLSRAVEQSSASVIITNIDGIIEYVNPKCCEITGYDSNELIGVNPKILKSGKMSSEEYKHLWDKISRGNEWRGELYNKKKNGELYWESASISAIKNEIGKITHYVAIKEDITEKKEMNNELLKSKENAEKSDRLKSEFLAQISHEIRTPINTLLSFTGLIKEEVHDKVSKELSESFDVIKGAGERITKTIDSILNMSEIQIGSYDFVEEHFNLYNDVIDKLLSQWKFNAKQKNLEIIINRFEENDEILGDTNSVGQIFNNLVENAIKYTNEGHVSLSINNSNGQIVVEVTDTGIGISKEFLPNLFDAFSQEEQGYTRRFEGNGLGLTLVKEYCKMNSAEVSVNSAKGKGTTFTVVFNNSARFDST